MKESRRTYVSGVRTSPIQYEDSHMDFETQKKPKPISQPVRQGNRKYPVSPIYSKKKQLVL